MVGKGSSEMTENRKIRVLLVDDEKRFLATTSSALRRRGFDVDTAGGGSEAVLKVWKDDYDVVVLDVKMPGSDGHTVLREIKGLKPDIEVILLTGHGSLESALEGWHDAMFTYLTKPCDIDTLADTIRSAWKTRSTNSTAGSTKPRPRRDIQGTAGELGRRRDVEKKTGSWSGKRKSAW
jgi:DNA-binding NtrC family response regulator